jgi:hypothetical protein
LNWPDRKREIEGPIGAEKERRTEAGGADDGESWGEPESGAERSRRTDRVTWDDSGRIGESRSAPESGSGSETGGACEIRNATVAEIREVGKKVAVGVASAVRLLVGSGTTHGASQKAESVWVLLTTVSDRQPGSSISEGKEPDETQLRKPMYRFWLLDAWASVKSCIVLTRK